MQLNKQDIDALPKVKRLNLINSVTGIKPGNMIGTISSQGYTNLAVFSSIVHLGSDPALIGFILRPRTQTRRDTYANILETKTYTINHINTDVTKRAHYTSARFEPEKSEFKSCHFSEQYHPPFNAPFVQGSAIQIGMRHVDSLPIEANDTLMVIGRVELLVLPETLLNDEWMIDLAQAKSAGIGGLNSYYDLGNRRDYPYARVDELPNFY